MRMEQEALLMEMVNIQKELGGILKVREDT